jgi:hypothetical protein
MEIIAARCHRRPRCSRKNVDWQSATASFDYAWTDGNLEA